MKEAIGGVSIFQIAILFILIFTGIMCLTINHSKAFAVKDEIINIIQNEKFASHKEGEYYVMNDDVSQKIAESLNNAGYRVSSKCPDDYQGYTREGQETNGEASYCIRIKDVAKALNSSAKDTCKNNKCEVASTGFPDMVYYDVILFYQLDIPIINNIMNFKIYGSTKSIMR